MKEFGFKHDLELSKKVALAREHSMDRAMREQSRKLGQYEAELKEA